MSRLSDVWQREKDKLRDMTFKKKVEYIAGNWWLEIFGVALAIAVLWFAVTSIINAQKTNVLFLAAVDVNVSAAQYDKNCADFKAYIGDDRWDHMVSADTNVPSLGALEVVGDDVTEFQQKSMVLIGSGLVDVYICPQMYVDYLLNYEELLPLSEVLTDAQLTQYGERLTLDGYALLLGGTSGAKAWNVGYKPAYLVVTNSMHYPDVVRAFVDFSMQ